MEAVLQSCGACAAMCYCLPAAAARGPAWGLAMVRLAGAVAAIGMVAAGCERSASCVGGQCSVAFACMQRRSSRAAYLHVGSTLGWAARLAGHGSRRLHVSKAWQRLCSKAGDGRVARCLGKEQASGQKAGCGGVAGTGADLLQSSYGGVAGARGRCDARGDGATHLLERGLGAAAHAHQHINKQQ
jgi:hypothetical protein